jgi:hypothetical protein
LKRNGQLAIALAGRYERGGWFLKGSIMTSSIGADGIRRRTILATAMAVPVIAGLFHPSASLAQAETDPLSSWNEGKPKRSIIDYVGRVTKQGSADFVAPAERLAVFDIKPKVSVSWSAARSACWHSFWR